MKIAAAGLTDRGLARGSNEDYFAIDHTINLYIVADGMGGHLAGEIASKVAVEVVRKNVNRWITNNSTEDELFDFPNETLSRTGNYILSSIKLANRVIHEMSKGYTEYRGMGTTIGVVEIMPSTVVVANVGDSRIYLIRGDRIELVSREHSMATEQLDLGLISKEEAQNSPLKHVLTRNLGSLVTVDVDVFEIEPMSNDRYLLCTDGLTDLISDDEILAVIKNGDDPEHLCRKLVSEANKRGGHDNITVSLVIVNSRGDEKLRGMRRFARFLKE